MGTQKEFKSIIATLETENKALREKLKNIDTGATVTISRMELERLREIEDTHYNDWNKLNDAEKTIMELKISRSEYAQKAMDSIMAIVAKIK